MAAGIELLGGWFYTKGLANCCKVRVLSPIKFFTNITLAACARGHGSCLGSHMVERINMASHLTSQQHELNSLKNVYYQFLDISHFWFLS